MPLLEDVHQESMRKYGEEPLTAHREQGYRRFLGQLAWAALSRADFSFPTSFLSRFQAKPNRRVFLKWLASHLHYVQQMPATQCPHVGEPKERISFCDASWGVDSVSGAILIYKWTKDVASSFFSRKRAVKHSRSVASASACKMAVIYTVCVKYDIITT